MSDNELENIAITDDLMFQKFLAKRAIRFVELEIITNGGSTLFGYITGLDDDWLQITTTKGQLPQLISRQHIETIIETPRKFSELSSDAQDNIRRFSTRFREICGNAVRESERR